MTTDLTLTLTRRESLTGFMALLASASTVAKARTPVQRSTTVRFDREQFVADCVAANEGEHRQSAVREVLKRAVHDHDAVLRDLGGPTEAGLDVLHRSPDLTIFAAKWAPRMALVPHDHRMWALIGIYTGREDNILWRREEGSIRARGASVLFAGDVAALGSDAIHSVTNPLERFTGGIHIYGGDFFATRRSQWNQETLAEEPSDGSSIRTMFDRENERLRQMQVGENTEARSQRLE